LSPESQFNFLATALESLIRYLGLVAVSDFLQQGAFETKVNALLGSKIGRPMTLGSWLSLLQEVIRAFVTHHKEAQPRGMVTLISRHRDKFQPSEFAQQLDDLIAWRNRVVHRKGAEDLPAAIRQRYSQFNDLLTGLQFLANFELIVPSRTARGDPGTIEQKVVCMGDRQTFPVQDCRVEIPQALRAEVVLEESPLLLDATGQRVLMALYPLYLFDIYLREDELYNYLDSTWRCDRPYSVTFGPHQPAVPPLQIRRGEDPGRDHVLDAFSRRLAASVTGTHREELEKE
jgi:hypothetical protein